MTKPLPPFPLPYQAMPDAEAGVPLRHVFVRDLVLDARIGVYGHERERSQRVRINLDLAVAEDAAAHGDRLEHVLCYQTMVDAVIAIVAAGHINLVETLAERIADAMLADPRARSVRVMVEKLEAIPQAASVGVAIDRRRL